MCLTRKQPYALANVYRRGLMCSHNLQTTLSDQTRGGIFPNEVSQTCQVSDVRANSCTGDYILADGSTDVGKLILSFSWGDADSTPPSVAKGLCEA